MNIFLTDMATFADMNKAYEPFFSTGVRPVSCPLTCPRPSLATDLDGLQGSNLHRGQRAPFWGGC